MQRNFKLSFHWENWKTIFKIYPIYSIIKGEFFIHYQIDLLAFRLLLIQSSNDIENDDDQEDNESEELNQNSEGQKDTPTPVSTQI
ncbi:hypothetical protein [Cryptosporidium hominis TU502]|uniref:hypothetical protein n=1 Tax=Cryptosporidium hominis (strain TU502) TaxID=353151 RepID=UPI0000453636|nr:hypothetical protein [Cryptosporidium hominis TU502]